MSEPKIEKSTTEFEYSRDDEDYEQFQKEQFEYLEWDWESYMEI